jgi:DtxR family Mn-dependent transcriptional regulator
MDNKLSRSIQEYLKQIYKLNQGGGTASTTELAVRLKVAPASVTGMLQRMASSNPPLVIYKKHQGATLTETGERQALEIIRHHRLLETYLVSSLGYAWDEVHEEANRLEHDISEDLEMRIAQALGHPTRDPHGDLIPTAELTMPSENIRPLAALRANETATIRRVSGEDPALLRYLGQIGLIPEAQVTIKDYSTFDGNLTVLVEGQPSPLVLGTAVTSQIFVEKI